MGSRSVEKLESLVREEGGKLDSSLVEKDVLEAEAEVGGRNRPI